MKYIRCILQLILAIPFYYVSMVIINFLMSIINELSRLFEKSNGKVTQKVLSEFKFDITPIFHYIPDYNYIYALLGLFLAYFLILVPIKDLYKEINNIGKNYKGKNKSGNKKMELDKENEKLPTDTYKVKDALEIMSEQTRKELGNNQPETKPKSNTESSVRKERQTPKELLIDKQNESEKPLKINSEELYEEDGDFFLSQLEGTTTRLDSQAKNVLMTKPNAIKVEKNPASNLKDISSENKPITFEEFMEEAEKKDLEQKKLNKIEQEKLQKRLETSENK